MGDAGAGRSGMTVVSWRVDSTAWSIAMAMEASSLIVAMPGAKFCVGAVLFSAWPGIIWFKGVKLPTLC